VRCGNLDLSGLGLLLRFLVVLFQLMVLLFEPLKRASHLQRLHAAGAQCSEEHLATLENFYYSSQLCNAARHILSNHLQDAPVHMP